MHVGWESQLLETGFLSIFLCPLWSLAQIPQQCPPSLISIWSFRWLIVRIMLGAVSIMHTIRTNDDILFKHQMSLHIICAFLVKSIGKLMYTKKALKNLLRIRDNKAIVSVLLTSANSLKPLNSVN